MKNFLLLFLFFFSFCHLSHSQDAPNKLATKAFFVELGGNGLTFSFNMDTRFSNKMESFGGRLGIGYVGSPDEGGVLTIPVLVNHLFGRNGKYFEVGAGITYVSADADFVDDSESRVWGAMSFMYRSQPENGGFMWKIGFTPLIAEGVFIPYWLGLGLGYAF